MRLRRFWCAYDLRAAACLAAPRPSPASRATRLALPAPPQPAACLAAPTSQADDNLLLQSSRESSERSILSCRAKIHPERCVRWQQACN